MITILGFDKYHNARAIEVEGSKEEIQKLLEEQGWTNLVFLEE